MLSACTILHKRSSVSNRVPNLTALQFGELAVNTADGKLFTKISSSEVVSFLNSSCNPYILEPTLSAINTQHGSNTVTGVFAGVLNGFNNDVSGSGSSVANGEDNDIESDFSFIGSGLNNKIALTADYGAILGGSNNNLNHTNSFIVGSDITSHAENFTYVNNLSVLGKIYGDGSSLVGVTGGSGGGSSDVSGLSAKWENSSTVVQSNSTNWGITGDRYVTTSISTNSINKGTKVFAVSADLSYISTQDVTVVYDHDINNHMHGTVLDYNSSTGSLTADITSHTGSGTYSNWRINIGGTPTFVDSLVVSNNLSDVASSSIALANLNGVPKTELAGLSGNWQSVYTTFKNTSSTFLTSETDSQTLSFNETNKNLSISNGNTISLSALIDSIAIDTGVRALSSNWQNISTVVASNSATWATSVKKFDMVYSPDVISYSGTAASGSLTSQSVWTITKITYNSAGTISAQTTATNAVWDNRLTLSYS